MTNHAWCRNLARDEAVRAAEDGRSGPLPTLAEAIAAITNHDAPPGARVSESPCAGHADTGANTAGTGLRTERVTLEIQTHSPLPVSEWGWQEIVEDSDVRMVAFSVRVVDTSAQAVAESVAWEGARDAYRGRIARLTAERDAAIRERDEHKARVDYLERDRKVWALQSGSFEKEANALRARVAELEAAPAASGWLTAEEREAVQWAADAAYDKQHPAEDTLRSILARSTPPEVVLPVCEFTSLGNYEMGFLEAIGRVKRALAAAGVKVTEGNR